MVTEVYSAGLMSESYWFLEFKEYLKLKKNNVSDEDIKNEIVENNLFGSPNEYRSKRIYGYVRRRVETIDGELLHLFFSSDLSTQKIINLICILRNSRIFFDFVNEVYREKICLGMEFIENSDMNIFFKNKNLQNTDVAKWTDGTKKRLCSSFITMLTESNLLTLHEKKRIITPPILDIELERYLKSNSEDDIIKAITGVY